MTKTLIATLILLFSSMCFGGDRMQQTEMEAIVKKMASQAKGEKGFVEFVYKQVRMYLISDVQHNRMRIISPVAEYKSVTREQINEMMKANFHTALDARYAVSEGILYTAFIHPLSELSKDQVETAVNQVAMLAITFGSEYTSGGLVYGK